MGIDRDDGARRAGFRKRGFAERSTEDDTAAEGGARGITGYVKCSRFTMSPAVSRSRMSPAGRSSSGRSTDGRSP